MNGIHDVGGMHGFGPIRPEKNEPVFHAAWERRAFGIASLLIAAFRNLDQFRHAIERMDPVRYLSSSYYEHWLAGVETLLDDKSIVSRAELERRINRSAGRKAKRRVKPGAPSRSAPRAAQSDDERPARFKVGDQVVARMLNVIGHTRLPRYVRGRRGQIVYDNGAYVFPDTNAHELAPRRQHVYNVRFEARELWGDGARAGEFVHMDLWEDYLAPIG